MRRWVLIPLIVFLGIAGLFGFALTGDGPSLLPSQLIGKPAPTIEFPPLPDLKTEGQPVSGITKDAFARKQPVVVNFWASWCAPCVAEHPWLVALKEQSGVPILGINYKDEPVNARRFLGRFGNPYTAVGVDVDGRGAIEWGVAKMPETFVLNANGEIVFKHSGALDKALVETKIVPLIRELREAATKTAAASR